MKITTHTTFNRHGQEVRVSIPENEDRPRPHNHLCEECHEEFSCPIPSFESDGAGNCGLDEILCDSCFTKENG
jgi:hypothetical protein